METIFWIVFRSGLNRYDRRQYFEERKTLKDFHHWIEDCRSEIEIKYEIVIAIENMGVIEKKI